MLLSWFVVTFVSFSYTCTSKPCHSESQLNSFDLAPANLVAAVCGDEGQVAVLTTDDGSVQVRVFRDILHYMCDIFKKEKGNEEMKTVENKIQKEENKQAGQN